MSVPAPADLRAHRVEEVREVDDLRLARRVLDDGLALGKRRGHQQILGAGHGNRFEHEARAAQPRSARADVAVLDRDVGAELPAGRRRECSPDARRSRSRPAGKRRPCRNAPAAGRARGSTHASCAPARTARRARGSSRRRPRHACLSSIVTLTPMRPSNSIMVVTSCRCGTLPTDTVPSASSVAARIGSAAFLAPEMRTSPSSGTPPWICSLSTTRIPARPARRPLPADSAPAW